MQEIALQAVEYIKANLAVSSAISIIAGIAASKSVAHDRRWGVVVYLVVGLVGFFLGQFVILCLDFRQYLEQIPSFRILFDLIAAYIGSFIFAALIHFIKPM